MDCVLIKIIDAEVQCNECILITTTILYWITIDKEMKAYAQCQGFNMVTCKTITNLLLHEFKVHRLSSDISFNPE